MQFIEQHLKGSGNWGTYLLSISLTLFAFALGSIVSQVVLFSLGLNPVEILPEDNKNLLLALMIAPFIVACITLLVCIRFLHKQPILSAITARDRFDWKRFSFSFLLWFAISAVFLVVDGYFGGQLEWNFSADRFFPLLAVALLMMPLQSFTEDLLFRGLLLQAFSRWTKNGVLAVAISGILFGLVHAGNPEVAKIGTIAILYYVWTGIFLALIAHLDDGLELGIGFHAANNLFAAIVVTNNWQVLQTDALFMSKAAPSFDWGIILVMFVVQPLMVLLFAKKYKWTEIAKKLKSY